MDTQLIPIDQFQTFLVVTSRVAGFISAIPVFFATQTPARVKTGLVFAVALTLFPIMADAVPKISFSPGPFLFLIIGELLLGLLLFLFVLIGVKIWMIFARQLAIRFLNIIGARSFRNAEVFVVVFRHRIG